MSNTETITNENGIEIAVMYNYDLSPSQIEEGHGRHEVGKQVTVNFLHYVEVVIAGVGFDILPQLTKKQKEFITNNLELSL